MRMPPKKQAGQGRGRRIMSGVAMDLGTTSTQFFGTTDKVVRGLVERRLIPFRRLGGRIIFIRKELEEFLTSLEGCHVEEALANIEARRQP